MSRSYRKTPITGITTARSDARWKATAARKLRRRTKQDLITTLDGDKYAGKRWDLVDPWSSEKDGKLYWRSPVPKMMWK